MSTRRFIITFLARTLLLSAYTLQSEATIETELHDLFATSLHKKIESHDLFISNIVGVVLLASLIMVEIKCWLMRPEVRTSVKQLKYVGLPLALSVVYCHYRLKIIFSLEEARR